MYIQSRDLYVHYAIAVCLGCLNKFVFVCVKVPLPHQHALPHSDSESDASPARVTPLDPRDRDVPAPSAMFVCSSRPWSPLPGTCSSSPRPTQRPCIPAAFPTGGPANIPLQLPRTPCLVPTQDVSAALRILLSCIDICVAILVLHTTSTEARETHFAQRKQLKRRHAEDECVVPHVPPGRHMPSHTAIDNPHVRQIVDLVAWHIDMENARWYVKPRSTCWFEEYLFNIYTPDMFYDILRMRRRTFDRLVDDLRPFIQGQQTHWKQPIGVEKKVVVTLFKLMHGVSIPLVADKAALGKSTVSDILRQVCSAISKHFGHLISWPTGRRLSRIAAAFESKQWFPNCIGAIDGSHIYIAAPSNTVVAADHRNRNKSFSILLQGVVDRKCYFTSINTGPPGSLHDSAHFRSQSFTAGWKRGSWVGSMTTHSHGKRDSHSHLTLWPTEGTHS